jgi:hypothetical protein
VLDEDAVGVVLPELADRVHRQPDRAVAQRRDARAREVARLEEAVHAGGVAIDERAVKGRVVGGSARRARWLGRIGRWHAQQLGLDHECASGPDERAGIAERDPAVSTLGAGGADATRVDPPLEGGLAHPERQSELFGRQQHWTF